MTIPNIESLLEPVSADAPCGPPEMEYDEPTFGELERALQGKAEQQMGDHIVPAQDADWKDVGSRAQALLRKTKDIRVAVWLCRGLLNTDGFAGFAAGLQVTRGLVEKFWDGIYPKPEDDKDPIRVIKLMELCDGPTVIDRLRVVPVVASRTIGRFSLRDVAMATGELPAAPGTEPPKTSAIDGAFTECPLPDLQATADSVRLSIDSLAAMEDFVGQKVGVSQGPNFADLVKVLKAADKLLGSHLARRGAVSESAAAAIADGAVAGSGGAFAGGGPSLSGEINSREDVVRALDKICLYYERFEPSSPIPLLLQRSKRLVSASFMDIVRDLAPGGVAEVENLRGKDESQSS